jgi:hypothetical protein
MIILILVIALLGSQEKKTRLLEAGAKHIFDGINSGVKETGVGVPFPLLDSLRSGEILLTGTDASQSLHAAVLAVVLDLVGGDQDKLKEFKQNTKKLGKSQLSVSQFFLWLNGSIQAGRGAVSWLILNLILLLPDHEKRATLLDIAFGVPDTDIRAITSVHTPDAAPVEQSIFASALAPTPAPAPAPAFGPAFSDDPACAPFQKPTLKPSLFAAPLNLSSTKALAAPVVPESQAHMQQEHKDIPQVKIAPKSVSESDEKARPQDTESGNDDDDWEEDSEELDESDRAEHTREDPEDIEASESEEDGIDEDDAGEGEDSGIPTKIVLKDGHASYK